VQLLSDMFPGRYKCDNLSCQAHKRPRRISWIFVKRKPLHSFTLQVGLLFLQLVSFWRTFQEELSLLRRNYSSLKSTVHCYSIVVSVCLFALRLSACVNTAENPFFSVTKRSNIPVTQIHLSWLVRRALQRKDWTWFEISPDINCFLHQIF